MRVTIVTAYFAPEITPITHLYADLAADLAAYGAEVTVVTGMPNRGLSEPERAQYRQNTDVRAPEGYRILRVGPAGREGTGLLRRGLHFLVGAFALRKAAKTLPTDVYLLGSMPPFLGLVGAGLSRRARTVYVLQDIFPDSLLLMGKLKKTHPLIRVFRWMERVSYRRNTRFITLSEDMAQTLQSRGVDKKRIHVVGNWADAQAVRPVPRAENPLFDELGLDKNGFYAVYAGTLAVLQNPDLLLDALLFFRERKEAKESQTTPSANVVCRREQPHFACHCSNDGRQNAQGIRPHGAIRSTGEADGAGIDELRTAALNNPGDFLDGHAAPITLLIFGGGALTEHVRARIEAEGMTNVKLFPLLPPERAGEVYSLGDVALIPLAAEATRYATPSKTYTAMAAGRPLIITAAADSAWARTVSDADCGLVCPPGDKKALAEALMWMYAHRDALPALSQNARRCAVEALDRAAATRRYYEVLMMEE